MSLTPSPAPPPSPEQSARELDALVAERVMGWRWLTFSRLAMLLPTSIADDLLSRPGLGWTEGREGAAETDIEAHAIPHYPAVPRYSTDPAAMMEVVEAMRARSVYFALKWDAGSDWRARFFTGTVGMVERYADTPGRAVCLAALAARAAAPPEGMVTRA